jgi:hypothetical protein
MDSPTKLAANANLQYKTIIAKFGGTCQRCRCEILPGQQICWAGRGLTYHRYCV